MTPALATMHGSPEFDAPAIARLVPRAATSGGAVPRARNHGPINPLGSAYEAGGHNRRTYAWRPTSYRTNDAILGNLATLRDRARSAVRNDGYAKGAIDRLVANIVGTGLTLRSKAVDLAFRKDVDLLWDRWTDVSDADGLLEWCGQQTQAVRAWLEAGEVFIRLRPRLPIDELPVPLQVQVVEPELCPHTYTVYAPTSGNSIRAGIEFNPIGQRVAYWFHPSRPQLDDFDAGSLVRVPAELVIHLYDAIRPGQLRGVPHLTQALLKLHDLDKFDDATLLRQQMSNMFVGFVTRPASASDAAIDPLSGGTVMTDPRSEKPLVTLEPGTVQELDPGDDVTFAEPPGVSNTYDVFMRQQLLATCTGAGVPYEVLTGDMRGLNDRTMRVLLHEFRRRIMAWQHQLVGHQLCRRVWNAWMDRAYLSGALTMPAAYAADPEPWQRLDWSPHGWPYLHPVQDVEAQRAAARAGLTSRSAIVAEQGESAEDIDQEQADDNKRADALGLTYDSDSRYAAKKAAALGEDPNAGQTGEV